MSDGLDKHGRPQFTESFTFDRPAFRRRLVMWWYRSVVPLRCLVGHKWTGDGEMDFCLRCDRDHPVRVAYNLEGRTEDGAVAMGDGP